jgi:hypothetical protein
MKPTASSISEELIDPKNLAIAVWSFGFSRGFACGVRANRFSGVAKDAPQRIENPVTGLFGRINNSCFRTESFGVKLRAVAPYLIK